MDVNIQFKIAGQEAAMGLKNKAANRLKNVINTYPDGMEAREQLAQLYYDSGFFDLAGLYWFLSEPTPERQKCVAIYMDSVQQSPVQVWRDLKYRGDMGGLPDYARKKLQEIFDGKTAIENSPRIYNRRLPVARPEQSKWATWLFSAGCLLVFATVAVTFIAGISTVLEFVEALFKNT